MKYGIFGGSFNPVHNGHVILAISVLEYLDLDMLYVVPAKYPPHKRDEHIAGFNLRYRWVKKAFENLDRIVVSDLEGRREGKSYTIHTIEYFISLHGEKPFLIIGSDNAVNFEKWYMYDRIMKLSKVCVYPRKGYEKERSKFKNFEWLDLPLIGISASEIRERIRQGKTIRGYVSDLIIDEVEEIYARG